MFVVGRIETTHAQWTVGEFTYAYVRVYTASLKQDYIVTHASRDGFSLYLPKKNIRLKDLSFSEAVPVRIRVSHVMDLAPQDMTEAGFGMVAKNILLEVARELATRCPKRTSCMCRLGGGVIAACGSVLGQQEFLIDGMIAKQTT